MSVATVLHMRAHVNNTFRVSLSKSNVKSDNASIAIFLLVFLLSQSRKGFPGSSYVEYLVDALLIQLDTPLLLTVLSRLE